MPPFVTDEFSFVLKPSTIPGAGIGVFATHSIAKGSQIKLFPDNSHTRRLKEKDIPELFRQFCIAEEDDWYKCPMQFNQMEIFWFTNHSANPNIEWRDGWYTLKKIEPGDEIFIDYNTFAEPAEKKEAYYRDSSTSTESRMSRI